MNDLRVKAIREDSIVGDNTMSSVEMCRTDRELVEELDRDKITTTTEALKWAWEAEELYLEIGLNQRWGEDSDPELLAYKDFQEKVKVAKEALDA